MEPRAPVLEARDVRVHFGGVRAVDGVSITVGQGELLGLAGPNGSGKSTLLSAISRLTPIDSGDLHLNGTRYDTQRARLVAGLGIARTFQTVRLVRRLSVLENVMLGVDATRSDAFTTGPRGRIARERHSRSAALDALTRLGLEHLRASMPETLPYGTQRKVEIARALAMQPSILLLDEPMAGMSHGERAELADLIEELARDGLSEVLVEHDVGMLVRLCSRLVVMDRGKVIADGVATEVVKNPIVQDAYLGGEFVGTV